MSNFVKIKYIPSGKVLSQDIVINPNLITYIVEEKESQVCKLYVSGILEPFTIPNTLDKLYDKLLNVEAK